MSKEFKKPIIGSDVQLDITPELQKLIDDALQRETELRTGLRSRAYAKIIDLVSEGEIEGLVDGAKSIFLDETPVQNTDGSYNFQNFFVDSRTGTQAQTYVAGFELVENNISVQTEATFSSAVTRTITNTDIDAVRVVVSIPALYTTDYQGKIVGNEVEISIDLQSDGGGYNTVVSKVIRGKATNPYERSFRIDLTGDPPWDIRLTRVSVDSVAVENQNKTYFKSYTEIIDSKLTYPNSAIVALRVDAAQFQSIPRRAYDLKLLKIKVPTNYDPETRVYTGEWDGNFQVLWSDNPAWAYYDLLTNERYGLGGFIDETQVDKWALYEIARYCDELVDDGFGGFEPRMTCNIYFQTREEAYKVLNDMTTIFRGMAYWTSGSVTAVQDAPKDAEYLFTNSNVVDGMFSYSGASSKAKHTVALVAWNDPEDFYRQKIEYVEDQEAIATYGIITTEVTAVGCTSRGQANRVGRWLLYTEQNESRVVSFKTGTEAAILRPGQIVQIADELVAGTKLGGRIAAATSSTITLDRDYAFDPSGGTLSVMLETGVVETKTITGILGRVVSISGTFSTTPTVAAIWMLSTASLEVQSFRIISVNENSNGIYDVTALAYDSNKYAAVENGLELEERNYTTLNTRPAAVTNLTATESLFEAAGSVRTKVSVSWDKVQDAVSYQLQYFKDNDNEVLLTPQYANEMEIFDVSPGTYTFSVVAFNSLGRRSIVSSITKELYGKLSAPTDVSGFSILPNISNNAVLTWDKATDLDVLIGGQVRIRWTPATSAEWKDSIDIIEALSGTATSAQVPLLEGSYLAKFVDSSGNESENAAVIYTTVPYGNALNAVHTETEHSAFAGTKTNCEVSVDYGGLVISGNDEIDDVPDIDLMDDIDFIGSLYDTATYEFANTVDLGAVYPSRIIANINVQTFDIDDLIDSRLENIDDWTDFEGTLISDVYAKLYMRTTEDDPSGSPTWTEWKPFFIGEYTARGFQFKLEIQTDNVNHNIAIQELSVVIDMPDRTESARNIASGAGTYNAVFTSPFWETPGIVISAYNMATGDYYAISSQTTDGFSIVFRNAGGSAVNRTFDYVAKGYGREII